MEKPEPSKRPADVPPRKTAPLAAYRQRGEQRLERLAFWLLDGQRFVRAQPLDRAPKGANVAFYIDTNECITVADAPKPFRGRYLEVRPGAGGVTLERLAWMCGWDLAEKIHPMFAKS